MMGVLSVCMPLHSKLWIELEKIAKKVLRYQSLFIEKESSDPSLDRNMIHKYELMS